MNIIETKFNWNGTLSKRSHTDYVIIHHSAGSGSVESVHQIHLNNGWAGIGYNFYVRSDGQVYRGRPEDSVGAHTSGYNSVSVGVCFEGNFEGGAAMSAAQLKAGRELMAYLKELYPDAQFRRHRDFTATACPGGNFPFDEIVSSDSVGTELESVNDIVWELNQRGIITDVNLWLEKLAEDDNAYWLARKTANMTVNR